MGFNILDKLIFLSIQNCLNPPVIIYVSPVKILYTLKVLLFGLSFPVLLVPSELN